MVNAFNEIETSGQASPTCLDSVVGKSFVDGCQERFNFFIDQGTAHVECPPGAIVPPPCLCGLPCVLKQQNDEEHTGMCLWVCALGKCMSYDPAGHFEEDGTFVQQDTTDINTAASGEDLDLEQRFEQLEGMVQSGDTENYCVGVGPPCLPVFVRTLHLLQHMHPHNIPAAA